MLTFRDIAAGALSAASALTDHLFEQTLPDEALKLESYYTRVPSDLTGGSIPRARADMDPRVADVLGLQPGQVIQKHQLAAILAGLRADGQDLPGKDRKVRRYKQDGKADRIKLAGMDLCLSAPKSFSVAWAFAKTEAERASLIQCHLDARDFILRHIEHEIGHGRISINGRKTTEPAKLGWVSIEHYTARPTISIKRADPVTGVMGTEVYTLKPDMAGDPNVHSHNILPNVMVTKSGRVVSINQDILSRRIHEFGAIYQAALAQNLRDIGVDVDLCDTNLLAKLTAIPDDVSEAFSKRTKDAAGAAKEEAARRGVDWESLTPDAQVRFLKGGAKSSRRAKTDDLANQTAWNDQAKELGWEHRTVIGRVRPALRERIAAARTTGLPLLADLFKRRAVVSGPEITLQAVRGLIKWGFRSIADIKAVTKLMVQEGIRQDGQQTGLIWTETDGRVRVTTALHVEQEQEVIELARAASRDKSRALSGISLPPDLDFTTPAGIAQKSVMDAIAAGGEFAVAIGAAGSGKSAMLRPLVSAWRDQTLDVWGTSLSWKIATRMKDAGINETWALDPFLKRLTNGELQVTRNSVVVIDELGQIGTRHLLELLRLQKQIGFKIAAIGDDKQCKSIAAGAVIDLLRKALGDTIPELLAVIRQRTEREKAIANLFRDGKAADAISMKIEDQTAELVDGDAQHAVERVAALTMERRALGKELTISAPSNADAAAISVALRRLRKAAGEVGPVDTVVPCTDGRGAAYDLALAPGDKVRLFAQTRARFEKSGGHIGDNGSVLTVASITDTGMHLTTAENTTGFVTWRALKGTGERVRLGYGECLTIDSAQGLTSDEHIFALVSGSHGVDGFKGYVASSRHKHASWLIVSKGEEKKDVTGHRPLGIDDAVTDHDLWMNLSANLSKQVKRESATDLLTAFTDMKNGFAHSLQKTMRMIEGHEPDETIHLKRRASRKKNPVSVPQIMRDFGMQAGIY